MFSMLRYLRKSQIQPDFETQVKYHQMSKQGAPVASQKALLFSKRIFKARLNLLSMESFLWEVPLIFLPLCVNSTIGLHWIQFKR